MKSQRDNPDKKQALETRNELEKILNLGMNKVHNVKKFKTTIDEEGNKIIQNANEVLPKTHHIAMDYKKLQSEIDKESTAIIIDAAHFYLSGELVNEHSFIQQKMRLDKITICDILFQLKTAEHAIIKLLEEIDGGSINPRMFEVLGGLQRSKMEINARLTTYIHDMEKSYKSIKTIIKEKEAENSVNLGSDDYSVEDMHVTRGTKSFLKNLKENNILNADEGESME